MENLNFKLLMKQNKIPLNKYLEIMRYIAKINGYNKELTFSNNPKYKLQYDNVNFGSSTNKDYILYLLLNGKKEALKHRLNYLKRSSKIRGEWKKDIISPNNLSRIIIWDANNILKLE